MNGVSGSGSMGGTGDDMQDDEQYSRTQNELKMQDLAIEQFVVQREQLMQENELLEQRRIAHSGTRLPPIEHVQQYEEEIHQQEYVE